MDKVVVAPGIVIYKNVLKKEWDIINRLESVLGDENSPFKWQGAKVGMFEENLEHRNCQDFKYKKEHIPEGEYGDTLRAVHDDVNSALMECLADYGSMYGIRVEYIEAFNMVKYGPGQKFNVHSDDGDPYRCTISCVGYPNDEYEGGSLWFNHFDQDIQPEAGDFVISPSAFIYSHASKPVTSGIKYSIVIMTDRNAFAHQNDSPVYHSVEERQARGLS
jgi:hypothetical protein